MRDMVKLAQSRGVAVLALSARPSRASPYRRPFYAGIAKEYRVPYEGGILGEVLKDHSLKADPIHPNARLPPHRRAPCRDAKEKRSDLRRSEVLRPVEVPRGARASDSRPASLQSRRTRSLPQAMSETDRGSASSARSGRRRPRPGRAPRHSRRAASAPRAWVPRSEHRAIGPDEDRASRSAKCVLHAVPRDRCRAAAALA